MRIVSKMALPLTNYRKERAEDLGKDDCGVQEILKLKPGDHNYKSVDYKDPRVAEQLRVWRKHGAISFEELLPSDVELMKGLTGTPQEKAQQFREATHVKPNPVKRMKPTKKMKEPAKEPANESGAASNTAPTGPTRKKKG